MRRTPPPILLLVWLLLAHCTSSTTIAASPTVAGQASAATASARPQARIGTPRYDTGSPAYQDIFAGPAGSDEGGDGSQVSPYRTILRAWRAIPHDAQNRRTGAFRIRLLPGEYYGAFLDRDNDAPSLGDASTPLAIESADPSNRARIIADPLAARANLTLYKIQYAYLQNFDIRMDLTYGGQPLTEAGDAFQCEQCRYLLLRNMVIRGIRREAQTETVKLNQGEYLFLEENDISGAGDNPIDAVAVRHGWWVRNLIHDGINWCAYLKGGSADVLIADNAIYDCDEGGFTSGQGSTIVFMQAPLLRYEAYNIRVINNIIHDINGPALGVNGGTNILMAYNTGYNLGSERLGHLVAIRAGNRDCANSSDDPAADAALVARCQTQIDAGAWGTPTQGVDVELVPNSQIFLINNLLVGRAGVGYAVAALLVWAPREQSSGYSWAGPLPARFDEQLVVRGNLFWTNIEGGSAALVTADGCAPGNPTCNPTQLAAENAWNSIAPEFVDLAAGDVRPAAGGAMLRIVPAALPALSTSQLLAPEAAIVGELHGMSTVVTADYNGVARSSAVIGALLPGSQPGGGAPERRLYLAFVGSA